MKITDFGIILSRIKFQEKNLLLKIFTEQNGIVSGIVKNISRKNSSSYNSASLVQMQKFARLPDQLGTLSCELKREYQSCLMLDKLKLLSFNALASLIESSFAENESHKNTYNYLLYYLNKISHTDFSWNDYFNFELIILKDAGYGLQLDKCAVTNATESLIYVSPKSGKAVSSKAGKEYDHLLLRLPSFILSHEEPKTSAEIIQAFDLTEYFFKRYIWRERFYHNVQDCRNQLKSNTS